MDGGGPGALRVQRGDRWIDVGEQVEFVCNEIRQQPELAGGFNGIGFSQGSQFMRGVLERCQHTGPKMARLITLGGQHQGVMALPQCPQPSESQVGFSLCNLSHSLISFGAYAPWVRNHVVQAQFWRDPWDLDNYREFSQFLADINNDRNSAEKNHQYRDNILSLKEMVLFRFEDESVVVPRDSSWFSVYDAEKNHIVPVQDTALYKEDWIGLKELDATGRLTMLTAPGDHMHFGKTWFAENIYPFLTTEY